MSTRTRDRPRIMYGAAVCLAVFAWSADPAGATQLKVMKTGLGSGTVTSSPAGIDCGADCDEAFGSGVSVTLTATNAPGSTFVGWEGDCSGALGCTVTMDEDRSVRAVFDLTPAIPALTACTSAPGSTCTPADIQAYLTANPRVNTPARFLHALPVEYKQNWILMSRSESLQTGTAEFPRLLLPSADGRFVFTIGLAAHASYPAGHPNAIEYMQWDPVEKDFRFHEIVLDAIPELDPDGDGVGVIPPRPRGVSGDDVRCSRCHSTGNVRNAGPDVGTTGIPPGIVQAKNKPNWDSYDSWGGMTPFNRDRIYQGSVEAAAFRKIFNPWTWRANDAVRSIIEQLELQPPGVPPAHVITRQSGGTNDGHVIFDFDSSPPVLTEPAPSGTAAGISTNYSFDGVAGTGTGTSVERDGSFVTLHNSTFPTSDEGRAVRFFDVLGGLRNNLNQKRIADELVNHRFATGSVPIEIRPIALAITKGCLNVSGASIVSSPALTIDRSFFDARNGMTIDELVTDTETRAYGLTRRKADIQKLALDRTGDVYLGAAEDGLIQEYGGATFEGTSTAMSRIRQDVFRRNIGGVGFPDRTVMGGIYVDRELATYIPRVALYRYFLEPLGVAVDKWSMGVRGRSRTYTFADVFNTYFDVFIPELETSLTDDPVAGLSAPFDCAALIPAVNSTLGSLPPADGAGAIPRYTDIQRIFNRGCIECHGGLDYPPYSNYGSVLDLSEDEDPDPGDDRLDRSHDLVAAPPFVTADPATSYLYQRITDTSEDCPYGMMPCGGPPLSKVDVETIRRWIVGGSPSTRGDPHIKTIDGVNYDFQAAAEYVLLRGQNFEIQARQAAVETAIPLGPNPYTGLTSCVSVNTAAAVRVGRHRVTYQPDPGRERTAEGLQLRVDGNLTQISTSGVPLESGGRIVQTTAPGGIQIEAPGGTVVVITPGWWSHHQLWYMNIDVRHARATQGLMGAIAPGSWLPALPDGSHVGPRPDSLDQRYEALYRRFGDAWRVTAATSLFDYAPGTSTDTYNVEDWPNGESPQSCALPPEAPHPPPVAPLDPLPLDVAEQHCSAIVADDARANCVADVRVTGEPGFARTYLLGEEIERRPIPSAPALVSPEKFQTDLATPVSFTWERSADGARDGLTYRHCVWEVNERHTFNDCDVVPSGRAWLSGGLFLALLVALLGLLLLVLLLYLGLRQRPVLLVLVAMVILGAVIIAYLFGGPGTVSRSVDQLEPGKAYYWRVIAEDGLGGTVESETRRFEIEAI